MIASVLSVQQPHADFILYGGKWCENRSWRTNYRGPLFIHASRIDSMAMNAEHLKGYDPVESSPGKCRTGAIIGSVDLVACETVDVIWDLQELIEAKSPRDSVKEEYLTLFDLLSTKDPHTWDYVSGDWCWILSNPKPIEAIPAKGRLGIWTHEYV